jgi:hypothetical protein
MSSVAFRHGLLLLWLSVACGGQVQGGSDEPSHADEPADGSMKPSTATPEGDTELGACELGRKEDYRDPCPWVAEGRCYDDREMACNCACPRSGNSQCVSGFEAGAHGHVIVSCG